MNRPSISVVIPAINESADLEATLATVIAAKTCPNEIIVVDDASRHPLRDRVMAFSRFTIMRVIRNNIGVGAGRAKSMGLDAAGGELLIVMDSHMRPTFDWLDVCIDAYRAHPHSLLCPYSWGFEYPHTFEGRGCNFFAHESGCWDGVWRTHESDDATGKVVGSILGGCYVFGRSVLKKLGGYARHSLGWGYEEEYLSLRNWIAGGDCRLVAVPVEHQYKRTVDRKDINGQEWPGWTGWFNKHFAMATLWEDGRYESLYAPLMFAHYDIPALREAINRAAEDILFTRAHIAAIRRRTDREVGWMLGIPLADTVDEFKSFWKRYGRKP